MSSVESDDLPVAHTLWLGPVVGPMHAACLKSFGAVGQRIVLHCYDRPNGLPENVEIADAGLTIPKGKVFKHARTGSHTSFADVFRYLLLQGGADLWVDSDMFAIRPIRRRPYVFGFETPGRVNQAVLALPPGSPLLDDLVNLVTDPRAPMPWISGSRLWRARAAGFLTRKTMLAYLPWAAIGPTAITYLAAKHGVLEHALPIDVFYPVGYQNLGPLLDPSRSVEDLIAPRTEAIHLYCSALERITHGAPPPPGSPLAALLSR